jgi:hypothetical protein
MSNLNLQLPGDGFVPGEILIGELTWDFDRDDAGIEIHLIWRTSGKGTTDTKKLTVHRIERAGCSGKQTFSFPLPLGPCSFSGRLITVSWTIEAQMTGADTKYTRDIVLSPTRQELVLA